MNTNGLGKMRRRGVAARSYGLVRKPQVNPGLLARGGAVLLAGCLATARLAVADGVSPYTGLWVGPVALTTVNEVSIPKDANNVDVAPNPAIPTVTADRADLLLILHVNGAGQVSLLKDVAVVNRNASGESSATLADVAAAGSDESSLALVTDPDLYAEYPMQKAVRMSSVVFDFGDAQATAAVDALVSNVVARTVTYTQGAPLSSIDTIAERNDAVNAQAPLIANALAGTVTTANVAAAFGTFVGAFTPADVLAVAQSPNGSEAAALASQATNLMNASFFADTREIEMVEAVRAAGTNAALNVASAFADTANLYQRFVSGKILGDALTASAACASTNPAVTLTALKGGPASAATTEALRIQALSSPYTDTRAVTALDAVLNAVRAAAQALSSSPASEIREAALAAGKAALAEEVIRYPLPRTAPTADYTAFVTSSAFAGAPLSAARAALAAALLEKVDNSLTWQARIESVAYDAAVNALQSVYSAAALAARNELPMAGAFGLGAGDSRFTADVLPLGQLGAAGLTGTIRLPANHPTNPYRHRRHPDHSTGFDITRNIRIDFDAQASTNEMVSAAYGVSSITGMYREEVFGLHKPLGANKDTGLKTEGRFQLNRISRIDTLNAQ